MQVKISTEGNQNKIAKKKKKCATENNLIHYLVYIRSSGERARGRERGLLASVEMHVQRVCVTAMASFQYMLFFILTPILSGPHNHQFFPTFRHV